MKLVWAPFGACMIVMLFLLSAIIPLISTNGGGLSEYTARTGQISPYDEKDMVNPDVTTLNSELRNQSSTPMSYAPISTLGQTGGLVPYDGNPLQFDGYLNESWIQHGLYMGWEFSGWERYDGETHIIDRSPIIYNEFNFPTEIGAKPSDEVDVRYPFVSPLYCFRPGSYSPFFESFPNEYGYCDWGYINGLGITYIADYPVIMYIYSEATNTWGAKSFQYQGNTKIQTNFGEREVKVFSSENNEGAGHISISLYYGEYEKILYQSIQIGQENGFEWHVTQSLYSSDGWWATKLPGPTNLKAVPSENAINLNWDKPLFDDLDHEIINYNIYRNISPEHDLYRVIYPEGWIWQPSPVPPPDCFYTDINVIPGVTYSYFVKVARYMGLIDFKSYSSNLIFVKSGGTEPDIEVLSPNGGETWYAGEVREIKWESTGDVGSHVNIELYRKGVGVQLEYIESIVAADNKAGTNSFTWIIGRSVEPGINYLVRISSSQHPDVFDQSDNEFTIGGIRLIYPNGGEQFSIGEKVLIQWVTLGTFPERLWIRLVPEARSSGPDRYSRFMKQIASDVEDSGNLEWTIPKDIRGPENWRILIGVTSNQAVEDISDSAFAIRNPVRIIEPNYRISYNMRSTQLIKWESDLTLKDYPVKIIIHDVSDSSMDRVVAEGVPNTGQFAWQFNQTYPEFEKDPGLEVEDHSYLMEIIISDYGDTSLEPFDIELSENESIWANYWIVILGVIIGALLFGMAAVLPFIRALVNQGAKEMGVTPPLNVEDMKDLNSLENAVKDKTFVEGTVGDALAKARANKSEMAAKAGMTEEELEKMIAENKKMSEMTDEQLAQAFENFMKNKES